MVHPIHSRKKIKTKTENSKITFPLFEERPKKYVNYFFAVNSSLFNTIAHNYKIIFRQSPLALDRNEIKTCMIPFLRDPKKRFKIFKTNHKKNLFNFNKTIFFITLKSHQFNFTHFLILIITKADHLSVIQIII